MARQAKILSFDEAKRTTGAPRPSVVAPKGAKPGKPQKPSKSARPLKAPKGDERKSVRASASDGKKQARASKKVEAKRTRASGARAGAARTGSAAAPQTSFEEPRAFATRAKHSRSPLVSTSRPRADRMAHASRNLRSSSRRGEEPACEPEPKRESRFAQFKRERAKARADRTFGKQYGDAEKPSDASQSGPRAAVYKGEMGSSHRRAMRMQGTDGGAGFGVASGGSAKRAESGQGSRHGRLIACAAVTLSLVLTCAFLYPTAKQYYVSVRECDRLQAEYEAVAQRNAVIQSEVNSLSTDEGVEDRAREEFGWVKAGEHAVNVYGVSATDDESAFSANIVTGSVEAPETWYSVWLDPLFGVE